MFAGLLISAGPQVAARLAKPGVFDAPVRALMLLGLCSVVVFQVVPWLARSSVERSRQGASPLRAYGLLLLATLVGLLTPQLGTLAQGGWRFAHHQLLQFVATPTFVALLPLVAVSWELRRPSLDGADHVRIVSVAAISAWLVGVLVAASPQGMVMNCFAGTASAEYAAVGILETYPLRIVPTAAATVMVAGAYIAARRRLASFDRWSLAGLALFLAGRSVVDALGLASADLMAFEDPDLEIMPFRALTWAADTVGMSTTGFAVGLLCLANFGRAAGSAHDVPPAIPSSCWAYILVLLLGISPLFEPPIVVQFHSRRRSQFGTRFLTPSRSPGPVRRAGRPSSRTRSLDEVSGWLGAGGELRVHQAGRWAEPSGGDVVDPPRNQFWTDGVTVLADRRATMAQLASAVRHLRYFDSVSIAWRANPLHRLTAARQRWPFFEMASRALRERRIALLADPAPCDGARTVWFGSARFRRCAIPDDYPRRPLRRGHPPADHLLLIEIDPDARPQPVGAWLDTVTDVREPIAFSVNRSVGQVEPQFMTPGRSRPTDPLGRRIAARDWLGALLGLLAGFLGVALAGRRSALGAAWRSVRRSAMRAWALAGISTLLGVVIAEVVQWFVRP